jgi:ankyrin repeat protein
MLKVPAAVAAAAIQITAVDEDGRQALSRAVYNNMQETAEMLLHWAGSYDSDGSAAPLLLNHQDR